MENVKPTISSIKAILENETILTGLKNLANTNPDYQNQELTMKEAYNEYLDIKTILLESIKKGILDEISFNFRNAILSNLQNIQRYYSNVAQVIPQISALSYHIQISGIKRRVVEDIDTEAEINQITTLRRRYKRIVKDLEEAEKIKTRIDDLEEEVNTKLTSIQSVSESAIELEEKMSNVETNIDNIQLSIQEKQQEIENKKTQILAFSANVEETEEKIRIIEDDLKKRINNSIEISINRAKELIKEAEEALELKQTEGISKAYSSRLDKLTKEKTKNYWLYGAMGFIILTFLTGYLLTGGHIKFWIIDIGFSATDNIAFVVGRILLTGIGITGAIFCANRYVHIKNLEEDYEYKVVLSKSILAFSNKIKELDKDKVAEYLTSVLKELHKDPLRSRSTKNQKELDVNMLNQLTELLSKWKEMN